MKRQLLVGVCCVALCGTASLANAAGFRVSEQSAKATAMANAFAAQADDPSALAYNPAGISYLKGYQVSLGVTTILVPETEFTGTTKLTNGLTVTEQANRDIFFPPNFYATASLESIPLSFGLGVNSFFPLSKRWDAAGAFRDSIQQISIKPVNFQPTVAYRFNDLKLSVATGLDVTYAQVSLQKIAYSPWPPTSATNPYTELGPLGVDGTAVGVGYNLGVLWKPMNQFSFGIAYRSQIHLDINGSANFSSTVAGLPATTTTSAATSITLPDILTLAVAYKPLDRLTLEFDAERTGWSSYDQLYIVFGAPLTSFNKPAPKNWEDVWAYRFGSQYGVTKNLDLRMGYAYDISPQPNNTAGPELPDANRHNLSCGLGLHNDHNALDLAFMWVHFENRSVNPSAYNNGISGTFKSDVYIVGANATMKF